MQPSGWQRAQLLMQLDQLGSALPVFYAPVNKSRWVVADGEASVDGTCTTSSRGPPKHCGVDGHGGLHETFVYWLNGAAPLASVLRRHRPSYYAKVRSVVHGLLGKYCDAGHAHTPSRWLQAFDDQIPARSATWSMFRLATALTQWAENNAEDAPQVTLCLNKYLLELAAHLAPTGGLTPAMGWSYYRWMEALSVVVWSTTAPTRPVDESAARAIAGLGHTLMSTGFDWAAWLSNGTNVMYNRSHPDPSHPSSLSTHGVNVGAALQAGVWQYRMSGNSTHLDAITPMVGNVWKYHGQANGMYSAEDNLAGLDPSKGTETCATNEALLSLYYAGGCTDEHGAQGGAAAEEGVGVGAGSGGGGGGGNGTLPLLDRAEKIAFNALPGPWRAGEFWQLQYHHQVNAFAAPQALHPAGFDPDSLGYGLPYECCAANSHQGFPRFSQYGSAMRSTRDGGVLLTGYMPGVVVDGAREITVTSDYPFDDATPITIGVRLAKGAEAFRLWLRVPAWAHEPSVTVATGVGAPAVRNVSLVAGRLWSVVVGGGATTLSLALPMRIVVQRRLNNAVASEKIRRIESGCGYLP